MSSDIHPVSPLSPLPEVANDFSRNAFDAAKETTQNLVDGANHAAAEVEELAGEVSHTTKDAAKRVADKAKEMYHQAADKAGDTLATTQEYVRKNPMTFVLGSLFIGAAVGYLIINARRKPTFAERFADEPMVSVRDAIRGAFAPVAHRVHDGYDSAREGVGKVMDQVHRLRPGRTAHSLSERFGRAAHNLKFW